MPLSLAPDESPLLSTWLYRKEKVLPDANGQRIQELLAQQLQYVAATESGWARLYQNPDDGCYWELSFPQSHLPGGGPPALTYLLPEEVGVRYGLV